MLPAAPRCRRARGAQKATKSEIIVGHTRIWARYRTKTCDDNFNERKTQLNRRLERGQLRCGRPTAHSLARQKRWIHNEFGYQIILLGTSIRLIGNALGPSVICNRILKETRPGSIVLVVRYTSRNDRGHAADVRSTRGKRFQIRHCVGIDSAWRVPSQQRSARKLRRPPLLRSRHRQFLRRRPAVNLADIIADHCCNFDRGRNCAR